MWSEMKAMSWIDADVRWRQKLCRWNLVCCTDYCVFYFQSLMFWAACCRSLPCWDVAVAGQRAQHPVPLLSDRDRRLRRVRAVVGRARARQSIPCQHRGHNGTAADNGWAAGDHRRSRQAVRHDEFSLVDEQSWRQHATWSHVHWRLSLTTLSFLPAVAASWLFIEQRNR